jgi:protein-disulfide isomerase
VAPGTNTRLYLIVGGIAVVALTTYALLTASRGDAVTEPLAMEIDQTEVQRAQGVSWGVDQAPVVLYEFADFQCPACMQFSTYTHPLIKERLIDTGIVRLVRYDFPLVLNHPHAFLAARAARCAAEQDRFWEYHDVLYGRQPTWSGMRNPSNEFESYAGLVGIQEGPFSECLNSDRHAEEVTRNLRLGESLGVSGTPTLMIDSERLNVADYNELEQRVMEAAGRTLPAAEQTPPAAPPTSG